MQNEENLIFKKKDGDCIHLAKLQAQNLVRTSVLFMYLSALRSSEKNGIAAL